MKTIVGVFRNKAVGCEDRALVTKTSLAARIKNALESPFVTEAERQHSRREALIAAATGSKETLCPRCGLLMDLCRGKARKAGKPAGQCCLE